MYQKKTMILKFLKKMPILKSRVIQLIPKRMNYENYENRAYGFSQIFALLYTKLISLCEFHFF